MGEVISGFRNEAKTFKALQKVLQRKGDFTSMQMATVCSGLAEVAEELAEIEVELIRKKRRDER